MKIHYLDSSIVIPLMATVIGTRAQRRDPQNLKAAHFVLKTKVKMKISVATYAETIRHFPNSDAAKVMLEYFDAPLPLNERHARRWARLQYRSERVMGDNDAWNAALAVAENGVVVGHDEEAFTDRPDVEYIDYMKA